MRTGQECDLTLGILHLSEGSKTSDILCFHFYPSLLFEYAYNISFSSYQSILNNSISVFTIERNSLVLTIRKMLGRFSTQFFHTFLGFRPFQNKSTTK